MTLRQFPSVLLVQLASPGLDECEAVGVPVEAQQNERHVHTETHVIRRDETKEGEIVVKRSGEQRGDFVVVCEMEK